MPAAVYEKKGGIANIILNRPKVHDALDAVVAPGAQPDRAPDGHPQAAMMIVNNVPRRGNPM